MLPIQLISNSLPYKNASEMCYRNDEMMNGASSNPNQIHNTENTHRLPNQEKCPSNSSTSTILDSNENLYIQFFPNPIESTICFSVSEEREAWAPHKRNPTFFFGAYPENVPIGCVNVFNLCTHLCKCRL